MRNKNQRSYTRKQAIVYYLENRLNCANCATHRAMWSKALIIAWKQAYGGI